MRRLVFLFYAFHFLVAADGQRGHPARADVHGELRPLSVFEAGLIVAAPAFAMLVPSLPVGLLSDQWVPAR